MRQRVPRIQLLLLSMVIVLLILSIVAPPARLGSGEARQGVRLERAAVTAPAIAQADVGTGR